MTSFRAVLSQINRLLPQSLQRHDASPEELAETLNHCAREDLLDRRTFLQIAGLITSTEGLAQLLFPRSAQAMYNLGAFWRKPSSGSAGSYPTNSGTDPYWDSVVLLMNMDTPTPSTGFTAVMADESTVGKMPTITGTPYNDSSTSPYSGRSGAAKFSGTTDCISFASSADFNFGSSDFTIEFWVKFAALPGSGTYWPIVSRRASNQHAFDVGIYNSAGTYYITAELSTSGTAITNSNNPVISAVVGTWYHIAFVRQSSTLRTFINGTQQASASFSSSVFASTAALTIGWESAANTYLNGTLADLRIYNGVAKYTSGFSSATTPIGLGTANDKYWGYCVLACPFENSLKDMSGRIMALSGSPVLTASPYKWGSASFNPTNGVCTTTVTNDLFDGDFTMEAWVYPTDTSGYRAVYANGNNLEFGINGGKIELYAGSLITGSSTISTNQWSHIAVTRLGNTLRFFLNGVLDSVTALSGSVGSSSGTIFIGGWNTGVDRFAGYIDSLRITKNCARYIASFAPPTASFPVGKDETVDPFWTYTVLAMHMDDLTDSAGRHTITANGAPTISSSTTKFGTGSTAFNGSNQNLTISSSSDFAVGTGDYTFEGFFYFNNQSGYQRFWETSSNICNVEFNGGSFYIYYNGNSNYPSRFFASNTWNHIACTRSAGVVRLFVNGIQATSFSDSTSYSSSTAIGIAGNSANTNGYLNGYVDDFRITKGVARYIQNFTPPTRTFATSAITSTDYDPFYSSLVLALSGNGTNGSAPTTDLVGRTLTTTGSAQIVTTGAPKFYGSHYFFNGSSYITPTVDSVFDLGISGEPFTVRFWLKSTFTTTSQYVISHAVGGVTWGAGGEQWLLLISNSGGGYVTFQWVGSGSPSTVSTTTPILDGNYHHFQVSYNGTTTYLFIDGVLKASSTGTYTKQTGTTTTRIGGQVSGANHFNGYLTDVEIYKGVCLATSSFVPPQMAMGTSAGIVTSGMVIHLDAGNAASYDGTSQYWRNICAAPADGSSQSTYDFLLGPSTSVETDDPAFAGVPGGRSINDYFYSADSTDRLTASNMTTFTNSMHQSGARYTIEIWYWQPGTSTSSPTLLTGCRPGTWGTGTEIGASGTGGGFSLQIGQSSGVAFSKSTAGNILNINGWNMIAVSVYEGGSSFFYANGGYALSSASETTWTTSYSSPSTGAAFQAFQFLGGVGMGNYPMPLGTRLAIARFYNRALTKAELDQNFSVTRGRFGL